VLYREKHHWYMAPLCADRYLVIISLLFLVGWFCMSAEYPSLTLFSTLESVPGAAGIQGEVRARRCSKKCATEAVVLLQEEIHRSLGLGWLGAVVYGKSPSPFQVSRRTKWRDAGITQLGCPFRQEIKI
jgi:hypothetical protein